VALPAATCATAIAQLPWDHAITLIEATKEPSQRIWNAEQAREHGWSRNVLLPVPQPSGENGKERH
jgi:predicted nuclease of restriction endonuclease-like (RecB) superfamily